MPTPPPSSEPTASTPTPAEPACRARAGRRLVVALGGNAITRHGEEGSVAQDYANLRRSLESVVDLIAGGAQVVLTHGNGPQVGNHMIRVELARGRAPDLPLDILVADLQGGLGYMIERVLRNSLLRRGIETPVCTLLSLVEVDADDPAMKEPTKFVGSAYSADEARVLANEHGWRLVEDGGRGFRRVVPSPDPRSVVERDLIRKLVDFGALVIVTGGGGIPVARLADGSLEGVEAVIDKDMVAALLAFDLGADELLILTSVEHVLLDFGTPEERPIATIRAVDMRAHIADGMFAAGSMQPKVEAACRFVEASGKRALITDIFTLGAALDGATGTWIVP